MVEQERGIDRVLQALAHPARREMLHQLRSGEQNVSALAAPLQMSFAGASKHVRVLERAGLVQRRIAGREHLCRLNMQRLHEVRAFVQALVDDTPAAPAISAPAQATERAQTDLTLDELLGQMQADLQRAVEAPVVRRRAAGQRASVGFGAP
jgi:DNA-binding transcriptional ArsR family regulator